MNGYALVHFFPTHARQARQGSIGSRVRMATAAAVLASPAHAQPSHPATMEKMVTWKELRRAYDFADNVTAQGVS